MNRREAFTFAVKATALAEVTGSSVDDAIRFLAAVYVIENPKVVKISELTGISTTMVRKLIEADASMAIY